MRRTVGARIEAIAAKKLLPSGSRLAELFGVSYETLRKWRDGSSAPNRSRQAVIAGVLGVPAEAFMFGVEDSAETPDFGAKFSLAAIELAQRFDAVAPERQRALYAILLDEIRRASTDQPPEPGELPTLSRRPGSRTAPDKSRA